MVGMDRMFIERVCVVAGTPGKIVNDIYNRDVTSSVP